MMLSENEIQDPNVCVCGLGVVGTAVFNCFLERKLNPIPYDKYKDGGIGVPEDMLMANLVFLCLPTPFSGELQEYDKSAIHDVCSFLSKNRYEGLVVLKSTVEPGVSISLADKYKLRVTHNPEFLTAQTAQEDFENQSHIVIGTKSNQDREQLSTFYKKHWPKAIISYCTPSESEMMKLGVNCFYATKIQFLNELFLFSQQKEINYNTVLQMMLKNGWISEHHTKVPGTDGKLSYGGLCFPKDTNALYQAMKRENSPCAVLEAVIKERNSLRDD